VPFALGQKMAGLIPGARLVTVPGSHRALFTTHAGVLVEETKKLMAVS
jgi:hypothetical protein